MDNIAVAKIVVIVLLNFFYGRCMRKVKEKLNVVVPGPLLINLCIQQTICFLFVNLRSSFIFPFIFMREKSSLFWFSIVTSYPKDGLV